MISLNLKTITDGLIRDALKKVQDFLNKNSLLEGFSHMDVEFTVAEENRKIRHTLGTVPFDVMRTRITGPGEITFNYEQFDREFIDVTVTGPCRVRFFLGSYLQAVQQGETSG